MNTSLCPAIDSPESPQMNSKPPNTGMNMKIILITILSLSFMVMLGRAESNETMESMTNAEGAVQSKLDAFSKTKNHELLLEARKIASSLNSRQRENKLSVLDERCLRLQLKTLMAIQGARDLKYDPNAPENIVYVNVSPPDDGGQGVMAGMDPKAIRDPVARKKYEDAIEENNRKNEKLKRELWLSRGVDYAVIDIWYFVRNLPKDTEARTRAFQIIDDTVTDKAILKRLKSEEHPGLTR